MNPTVVVGLAFESSKIGKTKPALYRRGSLTSSMAPTTEEVEEREEGGPCSYQGLGMRWSQVWQRRTDIVSDPA